MPTGLESEFSKKSGTAWRAVEFQHATSTRKLVATKDEQEVLEEILEATKPPVPQGAEKLDYLLMTPFRYDAPYPVGSRFRRAGTTEGVFYASEHVRTALAELCYYRFRFFSESPDAELPGQHECLTVFSVSYASRKVLDLMQPPFVKDRALWVHPSDYGTTQDLSDRARVAGAEIIRYESVRDAEHGVNLALFSYAAFGAKKPMERQTWFLYLSEAEANCTRANADSHDEQWTFKRDQFEI